MPVYSAQGESGEERPLWVDPDPAAVHSQDPVQPTEGRRGGERRGVRLPEARLHSGLQYIAALLHQGAAL